MPVYHNGNTDDVALEGCVVPAGKNFTTTSNLLASQIPAGVTKLTDTPYWNPVVLSEVVSGSTGTTSVSIPETYRGLPLTDYYLKIRCTSGQATIKFNDASDGDFGESLILLAGKSDEEVIWQISDRDVFKVNIAFTTSTIVKVDVMVTK
jgi:hypothetical protein